MAARCHPIVSVAAARTLTSATRTDMALAAEAQSPRHAGGIGGIRLGEVVDLLLLDVPRHRRHARLETQAPIHSVSRLPTSLENGRADPEAASIPKECDLAIKCGLPGPQLRHTPRASREAAPRPRRRMRPSPRGARPST